MLCVRYLANEEKWSAKWYSKYECECACGISTYSLFIVSEKTPIVADHELFLLLRTLRLLPQLLLCSFSLPVFFFFSRASSLHHYNIFTRPPAPFLHTSRSSCLLAYFFFFFFLFPTSVITSLSFQLKLMFLLPQHLLPLCLCPLMDTHTARPPLVFPPGSSWCCTKTFCLLFSSCSLGFED